MEELFSQCSSDPIDLLQKITLDYNGLFTYSQFQFSICTFAEVTLFLLQHKTSFAKQKSLVIVSYGFLCNLKILLKNYLKLFNLL